MTNSWYFCNEKCLSLNNHLQREDRENFCFVRNDVDVGKYIRNSFLGVKIFLLKEQGQPQQINANKRKAKK